MLSNNVTKLTSPYPQWRSRETSQEKLANQRQRQKENKTGIGRMSISFFNAFDLKHNYLVRKLNGYSLPTDSDLYMDTEVVDINHGHKAYNVYEWTILTYNRKGEQVKHRVVFNVFH